MAAERPWGAQGHQDHHRGPAPRDMELERLSSDDSLSADLLLLIMKFSMDFLLINAGMASKQFSDILLSVLSDKFNASLALINIINENETAV